MVIDLVLWESMQMPSFDKLIQTVASRLDYLGLALFIATVGPHEISCVHLAFCGVLNPHAIANQRVI